MPTHADNAQRTIDTIVASTAFRLKDLSEAVERLTAAGNADEAAKVAEEARRYATHRRRDYLVAVEDYFDAEMLDAGIPLDLIAKSPVVWRNY